MSTTTYCIPEGQLLSFIRDGDRYDVHCDALLSIRMVTDENGDVVLRREFDAWGGELAGSFDSVPGGMPYGFVGGAGCRKDPATGLVYMRARHYDAQLQRFISRDALMGDNRYAYADNSPLYFIDPSGLAPARPEHGPGLDPVGGSGIYRYRDGGHNGYTNDPRWIKTRYKPTPKPIPIPKEDECETFMEGSPSGGQGWSPWISGLGAKSCQDLAWDPV